MPVNQHEATFVSTFVVKAKRERYLSFLGRPDRRKKLLDRINHHDDFDPTTKTLVAPNARSAQAVLAHLRKLGVRGQCRIIADDGRLDGQEMSLDDTIAGATETRFAAIVYCLDGSHAFYKPEDPSDWYLLRKH